MGVGGNLNEMPYTFAQLEGLWIQNGGGRAAAPVAAAIALAESGGNPNATNYNSNGSIDRGLWQVNSTHGTQSTYDINGNTRAAISISSNGSNWSPWTTFTSGAYRSFLPASTTSPQYVGLSIPSPPSPFSLPFGPLSGFNLPDIGSLLGTVGQGVGSITGLGGIGKSIQNLADIIKFLFSYRFLYLIGGGILLLLGLYLLARNQDVGPSTTIYPKAEVPGIGKIVSRAEIL